MRLYRLSEKWSNYSMKIPRLVQIPHNTSFFLIGPRQSGKSTLIRDFLKDKNHWEVNLLIQREFLRYSKDPTLFREEALFQIKEEKIKYIFVDEIQKLPPLLDEIHQLIEETNCRFILSGSSVRKLKRTHSNLLAGRALLLNLFPLTYLELGKHFHLEKVLKSGSLAGVYFDSDSIKKKRLRTYVETYLKEEIAEEGLVRSLGPFQRFLDVAAQYAGQILNFENVAREAHVPAKTVRGYFDILEETLIGFYLPAWDLGVKKQLAKHSKFYFFDNGIVSALTQGLSEGFSPFSKGALFEQWLINEIRAQVSYQDAEFKFYFWRTQAGNEVDLIMAKGNSPKVAIEIKAMKKVGKKELSGLLSFSEDHPECTTLICVCDEPVPRISGKVQILPWSFFLQKRLRQLLDK